MSRLRMELESLPTDIVHDEILLKLPVKSLLRFKTVSKDWNSRISSPDFLQKHLDSQLTSPQQKIFRCYPRTNSKENFYITSASANNFTPLGQGLLSSTYLRKVGSVNGIVCFFPVKLERFRLLLWNPSMEQCRTIDIPGNTKLIEDHVFGFGYDSSTQDYKVVLFQYTRCYVMLYSLREEEWSRAIDIPLSHKLVRLVWCSLNVDGGSRIHWLAFFEDDNGDMYRSIVFFDLRENLFGQIALPESLAMVADDTDVDLACFVDERLDLLTLFEYKNVNKKESLSFCCDVWVAKRCDSVDYSWTKLNFRIELDRNFRALGFLSEHIILLTSGYKQILFDSRTLRKHSVPIGDGDISIHCYVGNYMENFLTLKDDRKPSNQRDLSIHKAASIIKFGCN